jgi:myosin heavy subunit
VKQHEQNNHIAETIITDYLQPSKPLSSLSKSSLINSLETVYSNVHKEKKEKEDLSLQLEAQKKLTEEEINKGKALQERFTGLEKDYKSLQTYLYQKKSEIEKLNYYQLTIQTQEKVIGKLQTLLESKSKGGKFSFLKEGTSSPALPPKEMQELQQLRAMAQQQQQQQQHPHHHHPHHHRHSSIPSIHEEKEKESNSNNEMEKLTEELVEKTNQLTNSNNEIVQLNNKIEELENMLKEMEETAAEAEKKPLSALPSVPQLPSIEGNDEDFNSIDISELIQKNEFGQRPSSISNLKKANLTIDKLTAENISKNFKIEALQRQLELSSKQSAQDIAKLRTKILELEIGMALVKPGDDGSWDFEGGLLDDENYDHEDITSENGDENNSQVPLVPSKPSSAPRLSRPVSGRSMKSNTSNSKLDGENSQVPTKLVHTTGNSNTNSHSSLAIVPEKNTIPNLPDPKVLRQESTIDIDKMPTPPSAKQRLANIGGGGGADPENSHEKDEKTLLNEIMTDINVSRQSVSQSPSKGRLIDDKNILNDIMNDIDVGNTRASLSQSNSKEKVGQDGEILKEIMNDIGK